MTDAVLSCANLSKHFMQGESRVDVLNDVTLAIKPGERVAIIGASGSGKTTLLQLIGGLDLPMQGESRVDVLNDVTLAIKPGERVAIIGASGSGKTTLLQLIGGLDLPTSGEISIAGQRIDQLSDATRGELRNRAVGFVYQFHHLLPEFSALENVAMPLLVRRMPINEAKAQAQALLERVGLGARLTHRPWQLSGGERQRAAVARALVTKPQVVLADEPTGNLDGANARQVFDLMLELNREVGTALVIVTHAPELAARMQRVLTLRDGKIENT